jgi:transposase InsO family protein
VVRYQRDHPGELVHLEVKKLAASPTAATRSTAGLPPAVDETSATTIRDHGVRIQRVLTDNAKAYAESILFAETAAGLGIRLKRTRRYRPQTNGKVERFNKTLLDEWAYARLYRSNDQRRRAFTRRLWFYHHRRPHTALDGLTPMAVLVTDVHGNHT